VTKLRAITRKYSLISHPNLVTFASAETGHSRKYPYLPHGGNWKVTPVPPSDVLIHLAEISSVGGVWIFSATTQSYIFRKICHFASENVSAGECNEITVHYFGKLW
jgi:hypothetical protein